MNSIVDNSDEMIYEMNFEKGHLVCILRIYQEEDSKFGFLKKLRSNALR
jgi:hypothetical protein